MKKAARCLALFLFVSLAHVALGFGQPTTGSLAGTVADQQGGVLPGATFFKFLPSPFDGFGVNLNYTFGDSSVTVFGRDDDLPFFKQSDRVGNAALIYEKYGVTGQIAVSYTSPNLGSLAGVGFDNYADSYTTVDAKISVPLSRRLRGFVDLRNLNDEARFRYSGIPERRTSYEIYSWNINVGFDWRF